MTIAEKIQYELSSAKESFEKAKEKFTNSFNINPFYAIEWETEKVIKAQHRFSLWNNLSKHFNNPARQGDKPVEDFMQDLHDAILCEARSFSQTTNTVYNNMKQIENSVRVEVYEYIKRHILK